jgi:hypothetical protein
MQVVPSPAIDTINKGLPEVSGTIDLELAATSTMLRGQPTLEALQTQEQFWQRRHQQTTAWLHVLTERASHLQQVEHRLTALHTTWSATHTAALQAQAPAPLLQEIDTTLAAIVTAQTPLEAQRTTVLDLQSRVAHEVARCEQVLAQIAQMQQQAVTEILVPHGLPLWRVALWTEARRALPEHLHEIATAYWMELRRYVHYPAAGLPWHAGLFLLLVLACGAARQQGRRWQATGEGVSSAFQVFQHPYAAAWLVTMLIVTAPSLQLPLVVRELAQIMALLPILRLLQPVVSASIVPCLYALGGLFALNTVQQAFAGALRLDQVLLVGETLVGLGLAGWTLGRLRRAPDARVGPLGVSALRLSAQLFVLAFAAGLSASSLGYVQLARLLTSGVLAAYVWALALTAAVQVASGFLAWALRVRPLQALHLVQHHRDLLERRLSRRQ